MKRIIKSRIFLVIVTAIIFGGIGVYAATNYSASQITYKSTTVDKALDELYTKKTNLPVICNYKNSTYGDSNNHLSIGTTYECDPGDGTKRNFYILSINNDSVDLIMEQNIAKGTMNWYDAIKIFNNNTNGINIKKNWNKVVDVDLPKAQDIANAVKKENWIAGNNNDWWCLETREKDQSNGPKYCYNTTNNDEKLKTLWLWDYTSECEDWNCNHSLNSEWAYGYWTRDLTFDSTRAWSVYRYGYLSDGPVANANLFGVRPVITVLKSQLN